MSTRAAAILEEIHGLPSGEREEVFRALVAEMGRKGSVRGGAQTAESRGEWARRRMAELEAIYGEGPRASANDVLNDLRADRI